LLFFVRAPEHHTPEMRELRHFWGLSRTERASRVKALREGNLAPAPVLKEMVEELESRRTLPAIRHYQTTILNEEMRSPGSLDLRRMFERLPPHEQTFLIERAEEKKQSIARSQPPTRDTTGVSSQVIPSSAARPFASIPPESNSYREYMASMGAIEIAAAERCRPAKAKGLRQYCHHQGRKSAFHHGSARIVAAGRTGHGS
jgi:hypothetical protein